MSSNGDMPEQEQPQQIEMMRARYAYVIAQVRGDEEAQSVLNVYGSQGWELVTISGDRLVLRRAIGMMTFQANEPDAS